MSKKGRWDTDSEGEEEGRSKKTKASVEEEPEISPVKVATASRDTEDAVLSQETSSQQPSPEKITSGDPSTEQELLETFFQGEDNGSSSSSLPPPTVKYNPLFHGCRSIDDYQRLNFIGEGTYGKVFRAKCKNTDEIVAVKQVKFAGKLSTKVGFPKDALRETNILLALSHPNIVAIKEMVVGSNDQIFMIMEYCDNDLKYCIEQKKAQQKSMIALGAKYIPPFSGGEVKQLMLQLLAAVEHMHDNWYIHRDLKTSNLLYSNTGKLTVCDFGMARKYGSPIKAYSHEVCTLWYRSPEILLGSRIYSTPLDCWSVACIFSEMLTGEVLFPGNGDVDQISKIFNMIGSPTEDKWPGFSSLPNASKISYRSSSKGKLRELFPSRLTDAYSGSYELSDPGFDLLSRLLHMDPKQRLSAKDALKHVWLTSEWPLATHPDTMPKFKSKHEMA